MTRPLASLSLDVDNLWSYLKIRGDAAWEARPTYLPEFLPRVLEVLRSENLRITFFLVGADAADARHAAVLGTVGRSGHEVANHSFEHEPWLDRYTDAAVHEELGRADRAIRAATGLAPVGFRGPGFSWSPTVLETVRELGYLFDASTFPTWLGPLARAYYFATAGISAGERAARAALFGGVAEGFRRLKPYYWQLKDGRRLLEIPVTTMPLIRAPFHLSYLLYLAQYSEGLALAYLRVALLLCRLTGTEPSILLHPLDFMGADLAPQLAFFPAMRLPSARKVAFFRRAIGVLRRSYELVPMGEHARAIAARSARLPVLTARAAQARA